MSFSETISIFCASIYLLFISFFFPLLAIFVPSLSHMKLTVVTQFYITEATNEYVINGNAAVMKCKIPSFVADFVDVEAWINVEDGTVLTASNDSSSYGYFLLYFPQWL